MSRPWMYGNRTTPEFWNGLKEFSNVALDHQRKTLAETIFCPCHDCKNVKRWSDIKEIEYHLVRRGFVDDYHIWIWHGEKLGATASNNHNEEIESPYCEGHENIEDDTTNANKVDEMIEALGENVEDQPQIFDEVSKAANTPLYPGCTKYSKLSGVLTLFNLKAKNGWSNTSFDSLLETLQDLLPEGNEIPSSTYYAKKLINPLGLDYTKIHACPNDCVLYRKEYENFDVCPKCGESRYKCEGSKVDRKKWPPAKVIWYLPIIPRFRRLFSIKKDAKHLVWHDEGRKKDDLIRHPADALQWKTIDDLFPDFGKEPRNLRLGLSSDGMNPYGTLSSQHSTWPVLLTIYNLPPWLCMKRKYILVSLLISGPKQPGNDIDVFLAPLLDDLKLLWNEGVPIFDAHKSINFTLRAVLLWTINDFPAYGNLSGFKVKSENGCPVCEEDLKSIWLSNSKKNVFMHTRMFLPRYHPYRRMKARFNGHIEERKNREPLTGTEVFERIKNVKTVYGKSQKTTSKKGVLWKKVSAFWELPYWQHLSVRHCLDVMHIEKNVCDSLTSTLLNVPGKTKDGLQVRKDLKEWNVRPKLWPSYSDANTAHLPRACYTLSKEEKKIFCESLHGIKVPTGYSSNIRRLVSLSDKRLIGMKSHDCHVMMQVFLPIALRGLLPKHVRHAIVKLCLFFNTICKKVIDPSTLGDLQKDITETLCQFEMYFPPSFFDIMVHLVLHLVREVQECGPVFLRWMYPFERYMGILKDKAKNRARPEGSIINGILAEEASNFCAVFLEMAKEIGVPVSRHEGRLQGKGTIGRKVVVPTPERFEKAHRYVIQNLSEVHPYVEKHLEILKRKNSKMSSYVLMQEHNRSFAKWFKNQVTNELDDHNVMVSDTIRWLARGPENLVTCFDAYDINGYCFHTRTRDSKSVQQNSGVMVVASSLEYSSARDTNPVDATQMYYGVIEEIWELDYVSFKVPVFRCKWVENRRGQKISEDGMTLVDSGRFRDGVEPFILASQAKQVFYVVDNIDPQWHVVVQGKRSIVGVEDVVDEEEYDEFDATPPLSIGVQPLQEGEDIVDDEEYDEDEGEYVVTTS